MQVLVDSTIGNLSETNKIKVQSCVLKSRAWVAWHGGVHVKKVHVAGHCQRKMCTFNIIGSNLKVLLEIRLFCERQARMLRMADAESLFAAYDTESKALLRYHQIL